MNCFSATMCLKYFDNISVKENESTLTVSKRKCSIRAEEI